MSSAHDSLLKVNSLKITFLVDNSIEWFARLPPGFTSEVAQHLSKHSPPVDERTGVPFVDLENYCCGAHGFSALIETQIEGSDPHTLLFDTGPDSKSIIRNIESMKIPVLAIERVIISHWHSDHSGGLLSFMNYRKEKESLELSTPPRPVVADLHPDRPIARGIAPPQRGGEVIGRLPDDPSFEAIKALGGEVELHAEPHVVAGNTVYVSGEIPRVTEFEKLGLIGGVRWIEDESGPPSWVPEPHIMDERYAAIDVLGKGLVIFSACSHAGIVNVVTHAVKTFSRPVHMVIGGLHLGGPELADRIAPTVDFLSNRLRPSPTYVLPMHCSGFGVKIALESAFGEGCVPCGVGVTASIQGDETMEKNIFPPVIA